MTHLNLTNSSAEISRTIVVRKIGVKTEFGLALSQIFI